MSVEVGKLTTNFALIAIFGMFSVTTTQADNTPAAPIPSVNAPITISSSEFTSVTNHPVKWDPVFQDWEVAAEIPPRQKYQAHIDCFAEAEKKIHELNAAAGKYNLKIELVGGQHCELDLVVPPDGDPHAPPFLIAKAKYKIRYLIRSR